MFQHFKELKIPDKRIKEINSNWHKLCIQRYARKLIPCTRLSDEAKMQAMSLLDITKIDLSDEYLKNLETFLDAYLPDHDLIMFHNLRYFIATGIHKDQSILDEL